MRQGKAWLHSFNNPQGVILAYFVVLLLIMLAIGIKFAIFPDSPSRPQGQSIQFDGHTIDISGASNVVVRSSTITETWEGVTRMTSAVTVTIWLLPQEQAP